MFHITRKRSLPLAALGVAMILIAIIAVYPRMVDLVIHGELTRPIYQYRTQVIDESEGHSAFLVSKQHDENLSTFTLNVPTEEVASVESLITAHPDVNPQISTFPNGNSTLVVVQAGYSPADSNAIVEGTEPTPMVVVAAIVYTLIAVIIGTGFCGALAVAGIEVARLCRRSR